MTHRHFHISYFPPNSGWPKGGYALYEITAEQIAKSMAFDQAGEVTYRDPWPGYMGTYDSMDAVAHAIEGRTK
jgi:hypothetical protein